MKAACQKASQSPPPDHPCNIPCHCHTGDPFAGVAICLFSLPHLAPRASPCYTIPVNLKLPPKTALCNFK